MIQLETQRLILRPFTPEDVDGVHRYAGDPETARFLFWGPNTRAQTEAFVAMAVSSAAQQPCTDYQYAAELKSTGRLIGGCSLTATGNQGEIGWILHKDYRRQGYGVEMARPLLPLAFDTLGLHRVLSHCDAENHGSYRIMEKLGLRREGHFFEARPGNQFLPGEYRDELCYAMTKGQWDTAQEIAAYQQLPYTFEDFIDVPELYDGVIRLVCTEKKPPIPEKGWVPSYHFAVCLGSEKIGIIDLRIGYRGGLMGDSLYYGGQIGYGIDAPHRGNGYAVRACRLLAPVARAHAMDTLLITNDHENHASARVCQKLGARLLRVARLPEWNDLYQLGQRFSNIFAWDLSAL